MVFREAREAYVADRSAQGHHNESYIMLYAVWARVFDDREITSITRQEVHWGVDRLTTERKWIPASRTTALNVLSGMFSWLLDQELVQVNPVERVPRRTGKAPRNERRSVLTQDQLARLLEVLKLVPPLRNAVVIAVSTGLRLGKITGLRPKDLQQDTDGSWYLSLYDKNGDLHRAYLFGEGEEIARRAAAESNDYLICGPNGGMLRSKYVHDHLKHCCQLAGISYSGIDYDGFCFHRLRALFASTLLNSGLDIETVAKAGNWKSLVIVQRYAKLSDSRKKAAFKLASEAFQARK